MAQKTNGKHFKQSGGKGASQVPQRVTTGYVPASAGPYAGASGHGPRSTRSSFSHSGKATASRPGHHGQAATPARSSRAGSPRRGEPKRRNVLSTVLIVIGVVLLLVAGGLWGYAQFQYHVQDENNAKLDAYASVSDDAAQPPTIDWAGLKAVNADVVGWVYIPGTHVDFPVYQGETNDTYLRTTATGEYAVGGQIFMDYENSKPGLVDRQTVLYGHHLNNGAMFADVDEFASQDYFNGIDTVWYLTEDANYELKPLFFYKSAATNGAARQVSFSSDDDFHTYLANALSQATAKSDDAGSAVSSVSKVLTLCTCDYENDFGKGNGRGLLVCALKSETGVTATTSGTAESPTVSAS